MRRWRRAVTIVRRLAPFIVAFLRDRRRWILFGKPARRTRESHARRADRLTDTIAGLGPTFIKLAQVFSARADILPEPYLSSVGRLQDRVPAVPLETIEAVFSTEMGQPVGEIFESFEPAPVAAASVAQVHRATLDGHPVAVKVLRPGVETLVALDLDVSFRILWVLNILFPNHHVRAVTNVVREFSVRVREEMDFRQEAEHIALFHKHFSEDRRVRAPRVHEPLTRQRVLVMEWIDGEKIDRLGPRFRAGELEFQRLMETLTEVYLRMMLVDGFLHADPHPGNILVQQDGTLVFIDWGMVVQLSRSTRDTIIKLALAAAREDLDAMVSAMYELGMIDPSIARAEIRDAAVEILAIVDRMRELGTRRAQEAIQEIMDTFYTWPLMLPRELVYFFRAAALLEGIGFRYDAEFNGLDIAKPVVRRMRVELVQAAARETRRTALNVVHEVRTGFAAIREVLNRAEREEFRIRVHPRDLLHGERFMLLQVRRILLSIFALTIALIAAITFLAVRSWWLLGGGLFIAFVMFLIVFLLPSHLLDNPLRHARGIRVD